MSQGNAISKRSCLLHTDGFLCYYAFTFKGHSSNEFQIAIAIIYPNNPIKYNTYIAENMVEVSISIMHIKGKRYTFSCCIGAKENAYGKTLQELDLKDDFLFAKVMQDVDICKDVLQEILGIPIERVELLETQKVIDIAYDSRGIRLLNRSFVIFIFIYDPFDAGRHIYTFEHICLEDQEIHLDDQTMRIFLNTEGTLPDVSDDMLALLSYIKQSTKQVAVKSGSKLVQKIHNKVEHVKQSPEMEVEYMTLLERDREKKEEGMEEGIKKGIKALVLDNLEEDIPGERIIAKLQKRFELSEEDATRAFLQYK